MGPNQFQVRVRKFLHGMVRDSRKKYQCSNSKAKSSAIAFRSSCKVFVPLQHESKIKQIDSQIPNFHECFLPLYNFNDKHLNSTAITHGSFPKKGDPNKDPKILYSLLWDPQKGTPNFGKSPHSCGRNPGTLASWLPIWLRLKELP